MGVDRLPSSEFGNFLFGWGFAAISPRQPNAFSELSPPAELLSHVSIFGGGACSFLPACRINKLALYLAAARFQTANQILNAENKEWTIILRPRVFPME